MFVYVPSLSRMLYNTAYDIRRMTYVYIMLYVSVHVCFYIFLDVAIRVPCWGSCFLCSLSLSLSLADGILQLRDSVGTAGGDNKTCVYVLLACYDLVCCVLCGFSLLCFVCLFMGVCVYVYIYIYADGGNKTT